MVNGTNLNGPMLLQLAKAYVSSVNEGRVPSVDSAWNCVLVFENDKLLKQIYESVR